MEHETEKQSSSSLTPVQTDTPPSEKKKSVFGLEENIASFLCYLAAFVSGLIIFLLEKENKAVRFHALQSIIAFGALTILNIVVGQIPYVGWVLGSLINLVYFVLWVVLMYKAYNGEQYKLPFVGDIAEKQVNK
ncbi:DUF4870 domain-containing protein [Alkalihalobacillus sp. LMS39]|uniref:DUF4870 domain-containing protein n=1 Tax=Alkalihalobacillus sp. LMS39 TaxID=2924032 RepID=UPI001FB22D1A|nr:DUF4870 domain-containing protein [Alkalihalobacillus sp. LMS39]UOE94036.1 DUF4870 domain-containing protein [Alkalihalobacillus sp. LMS39]